MVEITGRKREQVINKKGSSCVICGRPEKEIIDANKNVIPLYRINGDENDISVTNLVPMCKSCMYHCAHKDSPPYRFYHRQRKSGEYNNSDYSGPQLSRSEAIEQVKDNEKEIITPESVKKYSNKEGWEFNTDVFPKYYHRIKNNQ